MPFTYRRINDFGGKNEVYNSGKEILQLWLDLGSIKRAMNAYNAKYPEDQLLWIGTASNRIRRWASKNTDEAFKMIKKAQPDVNEEKVYETLVTWATRAYRWSMFQKWVVDKPWAKKYEQDYKAWYNVD